LYKKHDLLENASSPKLILVGGSNVLYGIDSGLIEQKTRYSVVNYGLRAETPLSFYWKEISPTLKRGDLVLFCLEYGYYYGASNDMAVTYLLQSYPQGFVNLLPEYLPKLPGLIRDMFPTQFVNYIEGHPDRNYQQMETDQWGDGVSLLDYKGYFLDEVGADRLKDPKFIDQDFVKEMNQFNRVAIQKSAQVALIYPSLWTVRLEKNKVWADDLDHYLKANLEITVLGTPERYSFPKELLSNSPYHLNRAGRQIRTEKMIEDIQSSDLSPDNFLTSP
jgi:hypothetical protein